MAKRVRISNERVNSYGFRVLTAGMEVDQYLRNPVLLYMHERGQVIGYMKDVEVKDGEVTGEPVYLQQSADLANLCATWTVSFDYRLPAETPLARLGANLTGAVWASTQNKHGAPGFCTQSGDALFKIYRATRDERYAELLRDIIHAHAEGIQPNGKITERLTYCDADSRGSRGDGGKTGWNETNGALMAIEIPGIYVRTDCQQAYCFDHVEIKDIRKSGNGISLTLYNPTAFDAVVTIFAEDGTQALQPLGDNAFTDWKQKVVVKAGKTKTVKL